MPDARLGARLRTGLLAFAGLAATGAAVPVPMGLPTAARLYASGSFDAETGASQAGDPAAPARVPAPGPCEVIAGAPPEAAAPLLALAQPASAGGARTAAESAIDRALAEPTSAGLHTSPRYDLQAGTSSDLPVLVRLYLRVPGSKVRACGAPGAAPQALHYYPVAPLWRSPSGLCHFSLQADENRELLARPVHDIDDDEAWRFQLFATPAERCEAVELERYVETAGVSDRDLSTFFKMWRAFVSSPVRFETALRRFQHAAPADLWRPPGEIEVLSNARERLRIVSIVNQREGDGLFERLSDDLAGPRLGVRFARLEGGDPWFDVRLGWGTMSLLGFRAR